MASNVPGLALRSAQLASAAALAASEQNGYIGHLIAPVASLEAAKFWYYKNPKSNIILPRLNFRVASGAKRQQVGVSLNVVEGELPPNLGLTVAVDDEDQRRMESQGGLSLMDFERDAAVRTLALQVEAERLGVFDLTPPATTAAVANGAWGIAGSTPLEDIDNVTNILYGDATAGTGITKDKLTGVMNHTTYVALKSNPELREQIKYANPGNYTTTLQQMTEYFGLKQLLIAMAQFNSDTPPVLSIAPIINGFFGLIYVDPASQQGQDMRNATPNVCRWGVHGGSDGWEIEAYRDADLGNGSNCERVTYRGGLVVQNTEGLAKITGVI